MAGSRYAYVRTSELPDALLPSTFLVIRLDGKGFHAFSKSHEFAKPNDVRALDLMNAAARRTMEGKELAGECVMGFGESDEYSFVFRRSCKLYGRRASKLLTLVVSLFTTAYTFYWNQYIQDSPLLEVALPVFDGRIVQYSTELEVRDYFRWRQVDTHINNMYNTCFWSLVLQASLTAKEANSELSGTISSQKQELLFTRFGINYNTLPPMFRKGSTLVWEDEVIPDPEVPSVETLSLESESSEPRQEVKLNPLGLPPQAKRKTKVSKPKRRVVVVHEDLIGDAWWVSGRGTGILDS